MLYQITGKQIDIGEALQIYVKSIFCLLYTSDAADE